MKLILGPAVILCFLVASAYGQSETRNLKHLTREAYIHQLELCADSAYTEMGIKNVKSSYDETAYEWIVGMIDEVVAKNFKGKITQDGTGHGDITYKVTKVRSKKNLSFAVVFIADGKETNPSYFLFGTMTDTGVEGIVKTYSCKKEIKASLVSLSDPRAL
jgi:hypothetical protein